MSLKYLFSGWGKEANKGVDVVRYSLPLAVRIKSEILQFSDSPLERKSLQVSCGTPHWPSDQGTQKRLGYSIAMACLLITCKNASNDSKELQAVSYFATRELRGSLDPVCFEYFDSLGLWIYNNRNKVTDARFPMEELVGGWVLSTTLNRQISSVDTALSLLIGIKICMACLSLNQVLLSEK